MAVIKDPVHGMVSFSGLELRLLDSPAMQRLRGVKQVAMAYLVYPGANHTRFEHSYGTMHLAGALASGLGLNRDDAELVRASALLHDVGHGAFSHEAEAVALERGGKGHEEAGWEKVRGSEIRETLSDSGMSLSELKPVFFGRGAGGIVSFGLGADRMDYLLRDSYYTGVAYGVTDSERMIRTIRLREGGLVIGEGGLEAAESILIARFLMFSAVYYHHTVRIASAMLKAAVRAGLEDKAIRAGELSELTDLGLLCRLSQSRQAKGIVARLENRALYKRALEANMDSLGADARRGLRARKAGEKLEEEIAEAAGVPPRDVIVDFPPLFEADAAGLVAEFGGKVAPLSEVSEIVRGIGRAGMERKSVIVACPKEEKREVNAAAKKVFAAL